VNLPKGFLSSGVEAGIKEGKPDLSLIIARKKATAAAVFTTNRFQAAPVTLSRLALKKTGGRVSAVLVNAGCANAITGRQGLDDARRVRKDLAEKLVCPEDEVFLASTGTIGLRLPVDKIRNAIPSAIAELTQDVDNASRAILTTDVGPKVASAEYKWKGGKGKIVGIAKGAGMIHPDMATMLVFIMTDAPATPRFLSLALKKAVNSSFHSITVDGDTSTNDTVLLMASGALGGRKMTSPASADDFVNALECVCGVLAQKIVSDGEGANRIMEIHVDGARSGREARLAANAVATSPLVKTALHGGDPNWGRILAAAGRSGAIFDISRVSLRIEDLFLVWEGGVAEYEEKEAAALFSKDVVRVYIDLKAGRGSAVKKTCDLGHNYVTLNADYRT